MIGSKLKVYLAENYVAVMNSMQSILSSFDQVSMIKDSQNAQDLFLLIEKDRPDAIIFGTEGPISGQMEAIKIIADQCPSIKSLVLMMHSGTFYINNAKDIAVDGFIGRPGQSKGMEKENSVDFYQNEIVVKGVTNQPVGRENAKYCKLTNREMEILLLICHDLTPGEISDRLQISEKTFFNHRGNILSKTNSRSNLGLMRYAIEQGYVKLKVLESAKQ